MSYCTHSTRGCVGSKYDLEVLAKVPCREFNPLSSSPESIHYSTHLLGCDFIDRLALTNDITWAISRKKQNGGPSFLSEHIVVKRHCRFYCGRSTLLLTYRSRCLALIKDTVEVRTEIKIKPAFRRYHLGSPSNTFYTTFLSNHSYSDQ